jgi:pyruvate dehydrogenase E2 component (dihydrolipoamide acetyltransferase)
MNLIEVKVPDIGDFKNVPVIEILVKEGDTIAEGDPLVTVESDKAAIEIPAPGAGKIAEIIIKLGDKVSEGSPILRLQSAGSAVPAPVKPVTVTTAAPPPAPAAASANSVAVPRGSNALPRPQEFGGAHASPSVRRIASELGLDLTKINGTGEKGRITKDDVKRALAGSAAPATSGSGIPDIPAQDFAKFGPIEEKPFSRLKKLSGPHLHRAWLNIPHVTHTDEADVTELEIYRKSLDIAAKDKGYRVTMLAFLLKSSVICLKEFPTFNASMNPAKDGLILKKYYHLGVAVDTPDGLVVPVIKDVNAKGIIEISQELASVSQRMRDGKITPADISGGTFSISSLGGIGGTSFTPIINAPEVAILGAARALMKPVWDSKDFKPRLMLPLCVSYDHRVIDGALAARFTRRLAEVLGDVRQLAL